MENADIKAGVDGLTLLRSISTPIRLLTKSPSMSHARCQNYYTGLNREIIAAQLGRKSASESKSQDI